MQRRRGAMAWPWRRVAARHQRDPIRTCGGAAVPSLEGAGQGFSPRQLGPDGRGPADGPSAVPSGGPAPPRRAGNVSRKMTTRRGVAGGLPARRCRGTPRGTPPTAGQACRGPALFAQRRSNWPTGL